MDAAIHGVRLRLRPVLADAGELELPECEQHVHREAPHRRRGVEVVLDRDELPAGVLDPVDGGGGISDRASETIELRDGDPVRRTRFDALERCLESAREAFEPGSSRSSCHSTTRCPWSFAYVSILSRCALRGDERLAVAASDAGNTDVAVEIHWPSAMPPSSSRRRAAARAAMRGTPPTPARPAGCAASPCPPARSGRRWTRDRQALRRRCCTSYSWLSSRLPPQQRLHRSKSIWP